MKRLIEIEVDGIPRQDGVQELCKYTCGHMDEEQHFCCLFDEVLEYDQDCIYRCAQCKEAYLEPVEAA